MDTITPNDILNLVSCLMRFPFPQICRHSVACDLLSLLETKRFPISNELASAVVQADDETALALLAKMKGPQS